LQYIHSGTLGSLTCSIRISCRMLRRKGEHSGRKAGGHPRLHCAARVGKAFLLVLYRRVRKAFVGLLSVCSEIVSSQATRQLVKPRAMGTATFSGPTRPRAGFAEPAPCRRPASEGRERRDPAPRNVPEIGWNVRTVKQDASVRRTRRGDRMAQRIQESIELRGPPEARALAAR